MSDFTIVITIFSICVILSIIICNFFTNDYHDVVYQNNDFSSDSEAGKMNLLKSIVDSYGIHIADEYKQWPTVYLQEILRVQYGWIPNTNDFQQPNLESHYWSKWAEVAAGISSTNYYNNIERDAENIEIVTRQLTGKAVDIYSNYDLTPSQRINANLQWMDVHQTKMRNSMNKRRTMEEFDKLWEDFKKLPQSEQDRRSRNSANYWNSPEGKKAMGKAQDAADYLGKHPIDFTKYMDGKGKKKK